MGWPYVKYKARHPPLMRNTLKCITETVRAWQEEEHDADGGHTDITADSVTLTPTSRSDPAVGRIVLYDELGREVILDASTSGVDTTGANAIQALRVRVSNDLIADDSSMENGGIAAMLGVLQPTGPGNAFGPGLLLRKPFTPVTPLDGWIMSVSETDSLLTGTSMLAFTNTREGDIVLMLRPVGAETAVSSYVFGPKGAYALGATVDLGRNSSGERFQNVYAENINANQSLTVNGSALGTWQIYTYSAGNFTASGSMTWGVDDGDEGFYYTRIGPSLTIQGLVVASDVAGTASNGLRLTLPASLVGATGPAQRGPILYQDAGGATAYGFWQVASGSTFIEFFKLDQSNWTLTSSDNTYLHLMNTTIFVNP